MPMQTIFTTANLILGRDGSSTRTGSSIGLSSDEDRKRFKQLREDSDLIVIGGNTARREPYKRTPIPLYILTHSKVRLQPKNQLAKQFTLSPTQLFEEIAQNFKPDHASSPIRVLVEAGPQLLQTLIDQGLIDQLFLSTNMSKDGENKISAKDLTNGFSLIKEEVVGEIKFERYNKA